VLSLPRDKFADFNPPDGKTFPDMLKEQLGEDEDRARTDMVDRAVQSIFTEMIAYRADLSYVPAKK
jgi:hypothetical protein